MSDSRDWWRKGFVTEFWRTSANQELAGMIVVGEVATISLLVALLMPVLKKIQDILQAEGTTVTAVHAGYLG